MKVIYIVENLGTATETFVDSLLEGLRDSVELVVVVDRIIGDPKAWSCPVYESGFQSSYRAVRISLQLLDRFFRKTSLHEQFVAWLANSKLAPIIKKERPAVAYIEHGNNAVLVGRCLKTWSLPYVVHFHGRDASQLLSSKNYRRQVVDIVAYSSATVVASRHMWRRLSLIGCNEDKLRLVRLGMDIEQIPEPDWHLSVVKGPTVIFVGRLVEKKQPLALVHAFRIVVERVPDAKMIIVGHGPLEGEVVERIEQLGLESKITLYGEGSQEEVFAMLAEATVYAQHSVTDSRGDQEGFSLSILEAAAFGLPVVATVHNGFPENVLHGVTGFLVPEYDYDAMGTHIAELLIDRDRCTEMGKRARTRVEQNFQLGVRATAILALLNEASGS
jgi:colanic acid/amylovoran biosynthesis glycosyltransferase